MVADAGEFSAARNVNLEIVVVHTTFQDQQDIKNVGIKY